MTQRQSFFGGPSGSVGPTAAKPRSLLAILTLVLVGCSGATSPVAEDPLTALRQDRHGRLSSALSTLPLYFIENRGQTDPRVSYYLQGAESSVYFTVGGPFFTNGTGASSRPSPDLNAVVRVEALGRPCRS